MTVRAVVLLAVRRRKGAFVRILRWAGRLWTAVLAVVVLLAGLLLGLRLLLPLFDRAPSLAGTVPADRAAGISPRARLTLRFDRPMNPRSVERAIAIAPAVGWAAEWSEDRTTLAISPTQTLQPDTDYRLSVGVAALSQRYRALAQPAELRFRTAAAPAVVQVLPADATDDVPRDSPISIRFSRPIVPAAALLRPQNLPELRLDPPAEGTTTWLDQTTALFRPAMPLRPGTRYRASLSADLADLAGVPLGSAYAWSFSTPAPKLLATWPAQNAQAVAPSATLALTISQPLDLGSARASLTISPTIAGQLAARNLPDGRQVLDYAPSGGWLPATTYTVTLAAGATPSEGNLPLLDTTNLIFSTAPRPALIARFPGEGQSLPNGQAISLVFNSPIDADAFRAAVRFDPPAGDIRVTSTDSEVRIGADLRAATAYTMTVPATLADRNAVPLGQEYRMRFQTAPAAATLSLPEAPAHLAEIAPGQPARLLVRRTNLSALSIDLYRLDEASTVRVLGFAEGDWSAFQPERYGQALLRSWRVPLTDPLNAPAEDRVDLAGADGAPLAAGAYYARMRALEGPRADLLLLVAQTRMTLWTHGAEALLWASDASSGAAAASLPIALYQGGALVRQGATGADGIFRFARAPGVPLASYVAIAGAGQYGAVSGGWGAPDAGAAQDSRIFLTTARAAYRPGERVHLAGFARAIDPRTGTVDGPRSGTVLASARPRDGGPRLYQRSLAVGATGVFSDAFRLDERAQPGDYVVTAAIDGASFQASFAVVPASPTPLDIAIRTLAEPAAGQPTPVAIDVRTAEGLPVAGTTISWTLTAEVATLPTAEGYTFGDDERSAALPPSSGGVAQTDPGGTYTLSISDTAGVPPLAYRLRVRATTADGATATAAATIDGAAAPAYAGVRPPSQIFAAGQAAPVDLLALAPDGQPAAGAALRVQVYRRTWERDSETGPDGAERPIWRPRDRLLLTRGAVTGADGRTSLALALPSAGAYRLRAGLAGGRPETAAAQTLWATAPGFTSWGELPGGAPLLIADRAIYRPGETARLLVLMPYARSSALVAYGEAAGLNGQVLNLRAGEPFTLTLRPDVAADVPVAVLLAPRPGAARASASAPPALELAQTSLAVRGDAQSLLVAVTADRAAYQPGATATLTVTTTDASGAGVSADVLLSLTGAGAAPSGDIGAAFRPSALPLAVAPAASGPPRFSAPRPAGSPAPDPVAAPESSEYWNSALRTGPDGMLTLTVDMPGEPAELQAQAWAASDTRAGHGRASLVVTQPLSLEIAAPPALRVGDQIEIAAQIASSDAISRELEVGLLAAGLRIEGGATATQRVTLAPGGRARVVWPAQVLEAQAASLSIGVRSAGIAPLSRQLQRPIAPGPAPGAPRDTGVALLREYVDPLTNQPLDLASLRVGQVVRVRLTAVVSARHGGLAIEDPLPAGAKLGSTGSGDFGQAAADHALALRRGASGPGIYQHSYLLRLATPGRYGVPAATARTPEGASGSGSAATLEISEP